MAGSIGCGRGHSRGRGSRVARSSSPKEEDCLCNKYFEFVFFINEDPFGKNKLSDAFVEFLAGEPAAVTLREARCDFCRWTVEVLFNGESKMYLHNDWKKFTRDHDIEVGCLVNFFYEGDGEMSVNRISSGMGLSINPVSHPIPLIPLIPLINSTNPVRD
jgi:hypothetical protein